MTSTDPGYLSHVSRGGELLKSERLGEAKQEFERALVIRPGDPKALALLGLACFRMSLYDEASSIYQALVDQSPQDSSLRLNLGLVHLKAGDTDRAILELEQATAIEPGQVRARGYLGLAYARRGEYGKARDAFRDAGQIELANEMETVLASQGEPMLDADVVEDGEALVVDSGLAAQDAADDSLRRIHQSGFDKIEASGGSLAGIDELAAHARARGDERWGAPASFDETTVSLVAAAARATLDTRPRTGVAVPLAQLVHAQLIMPRQAREVFEVQPSGALVVRVSGKLVSRTDGVVASGGELVYAPSMRRVKGRLTDEPFGSESSPVFEISGDGFLVALPRGARFTPIRLDDEALYLREDAVFSFEGNLRWETGKVPGSELAARSEHGESGEPLRFVNLRGDGRACIRTREAPMSIQVTPEWVLYVEAPKLLAWTGKVVPRVAARNEADAGTPIFVECSGDGIVVLERDAGEAEAVAG